MPIFASSKSSKPVLPPLGSPCCASDSRVS